ncbi:F-type H+-transporting ATPase subunit b [Tepidamorphus gemmatus]|uniref:ATP synthase subunit b n=1 Tax=Tepidamorphus gemmatus TaxID=747076 RepID=A0A4R3MF22_9HYPH|nr:F0F1 ATP synthase subunit B [Tepidamorphus gemmatus]TCT12091.1 F-type H+-transporting ATPase subunit b [Tepidamorphus gemmatus]
MLSYKETIIVLAQSDGQGSGIAEEVIHSEQTEISEAIGLEEHGSGGMPQFNFETYAPQIVWLIITFAVLYALMARVALPRIATVIEHRRDRIASDLDTAARLGAETDEVIAAYEAELAEARGRAHEIAAATRARLDAELGEERARVEAELAEKTADAERRIAESKARALAEVDGAAADAAAQIVEMLAGVKVSRSEVEAAVAAARGA